MKNKSVFPFYPLLFSLYPILALFAVNIDQVEIGVIVRPLLIAFFVASFLFIIFGVIFKNLQKSALYVLFILILFFTYGHVYQLLKNIPEIGSMIGRHRYLIPFYLLIFAGGSWLIIRRIRITPGITRALNVVMILLVLFPIVQSGSFYLKQYESIQKVSDQTNSHSALKAPENPPDIYYIILDMYTRQDALLNDYHFDNSTFLDELNQLGFYVAPCSRSNYDETTKSLASSLNMNYLPALNPKIKPGENDPTLVTSLLSNNKVRNLLQGMGYKTVAFETGYAWDSWTDADVYLKPQYGSSLLRQMRPFEALLIKTTALDALSDMGSIISKSYLNTINAPLAEHINRQEYILNKLNSLATLKGPKFVFAHILIPHYPFIFKADGSIQTDVNYYRDQNVPSSEAYFIDGYQNQVAFINSQIIPIVKSILSQSKTPPIIIIQGDHGAKDANRLENLNAYYLPGGKGNLYSSISPVNSFRLIFDQYFGGTYPLLPDVSYASSMNDPYGFTAQPEESLSCRP